MPRRRATEITENADDCPDHSEKIDSCTIPFAGFGEFDLLLAEHFDDAVAGIGGAADIGEAVWRGDLVLSDSGDDNFSVCGFDASVDD